MDTFQKQLQKIPARDRDRILAALVDLYARKFTSLDRKKLRGYENIFRIRIGNYRIIYFDDGTQILLKAVRARNEKTYKDF